ALAGKVVLVGSVATGTYDHYPTPFAAVMAGVEFHAAVIDNLLNRDPIRFAGLRWTYGLIIAFSLLCGLVLVRFSAWAGALWAVGTAVVYAGAAEGLFIRRHISFDLAGPLLTLAVAYVAIVIYR